jgi:N-acetylglutamate synthase-like GNAT family acetyltransferase
LHDFAEVMKIRNATTHDIPAIVALLKQSLGESLMPKSERYWKWKHIENPFGTSPVLLCEEADQLIGIRAFMRWKWTDKNRVYSAVRAVDTATHPAHQGKGIFKKLTLALVEQCKKDDDQFVFNTPNAQSKPGYLKMGWITAGKLPIRLSINSPFRIGKTLIRKSTEENILPGPEYNVTNYLTHPGLSRLLNQIKEEGEGLHTEYSVRYLDWRYRDVPVASYLAFGEANANDLSGLVIARVKQTRLGRELRITDCFLGKQGPIKSLKQQIAQCVSDLKIDYTTIAGTAMTGNTVRVLPGLNIFPKLPVGPAVTVRSLQLEDLGLFHNFAGWSPSFGDLELF